MASVDHWIFETRQTARSLWRSPGFLVTAVLSLALAIGAGAVAFSVLDAIRFRALPFRDADRLTLLSEVPVAAPTAPRAGARTCRAACSVSYTTWDQVLRDRSWKTLDAIAAWTAGAKALNVGGDPVLLTGGVVSPNLFDLLGARPLLGRTFSAEDDRVGAAPVVVLSHAMWTTYFAQDPRILGRTVKLSDTEYTVTGVMGPGFEHEEGSQFWLPAVPVLDPSTRPSIRSVTVVGRLAPGATIEQARAEAGAAQPSPEASRREPQRIEVAPLRARYAESTRSHDVIFAVIVAGIVLIAGANLANLVLVRTLHRGRELAVRAALGAATSRLTLALLVQNLLLALGGSLGGLILARWALSLVASVGTLNAIQPAGMEYRIDGRVVAFAVILALVVAVVLSVVPLRLMRGLSSGTALRTASPGAPAGRGSRAQRSFVVAQIAVAVVLAVGASLMIRTVLRLRDVSLGFDAERLVEGTPSFPHSWREPDKYLPVTREILAELAQLPEAEHVAVRATVPLGAARDPRVIPAGQPSPLPPSLVPGVAQAISPNYFDVVGVRLLRGRPFSGFDREGGSRVAILNEWAARRWWAGEDPVGRMVHVDTGVSPGPGIDLQVVGVAADNRAAQQSLQLAEPGPEVYVPWEQSSSAFPTFVARVRGVPAGALRPVRVTLARLVPDRPVFASSVSANAETQLAGVRTNAVQILGFAAVGLFMALLGVHGVLAYAVSRRTRELGVRSALGATSGRLRAMVLVDAFKLAATGLAIGVPLALGATRLLEDMLEGTSRTDPLVYALVILALLGITTLVGLGAARRATRVSAMVALRSE